MLERVKAAKGKELRELLTHHIGRGREGLADAFELVFGELKTLKKQIKTLQKEVKELQERTKGFKHES